MGSESLLSHFWVTFGSLWGRSARVTLESLLGHFNSFCASVELGGRPLHTSKVIVAFCLDCVDPCQTCCFNPRGDLPLSLYSSSPQSISVRGSAIRIARSWTCVLAERQGTQHRSHHSLAIVTMNETFCRRSLQRSQCCSPCHVTHS